LEYDLSLYEPTAVLVAEPGKIARGTSELAEALQGFLSLRPALTSIKHVKGPSSDLLRRRSDGPWLIAIVNPWGGAVPGRKTIRYDEKALEPTMPSNFSRFERFLSLTNPLKSHKIRSCYEKETQ